MRRAPAPLAASLLPAILLLAAGCSTRHTAAPAASASAAPTVDAYTALTPPDSPGVGSYDSLVANHAYAATQGYLASQLLEPTTLTGTATADLIGQLQGASGDTSLARDLGATPTRRGLGFRPLFARTVKDPVPTVVRSGYTADAVQGLGGEQALRITWSGSVHYAVLVGGLRRTAAYALTVSYVYTASSPDPAGVTLQVVVPGSFHASPVNTSCLAKGVLLPVPGTLTAADDTAGPWPTPAASGACPV